MLEGWGLKKFNNVSKPWGVVFLMLSCAALAFGPMLEVMASERCAGLSLTVFNHDQQ